MQKALVKDKDCDRVLRFNLNDSTFQILIKDTLTLVLDVAFSC